MSAFPSPRPQQGDPPSLRAALADFARGLFDLALPAVCAVCRRAMSGGEPGLVCGLCWGRLALLAPPRCDRCGHPTGGRSCRWCALLPPYVRAVRSVCWTHAGTGRAIVHALKYDGWSASAGGMAERMARLSWPPDVVEERTALVAVPLAPTRERERGYNQALLLARALGERWDVPVWEGALERSRSTVSQTRLTPDERRRNVSGAIRAVVPAGRLRGSHFVVVDDVVTTASTLNACAAALFEAGARIISFATFGRAPMPGDRT